MGEGSDNKPENISCVSAVENLCDLVKTYETLPDGVFKELIWDESWILASSIMRTLLRNMPSNSHLPGHETIIRGVPHKWGNG